MPQQQEQLTPIQGQTVATLAQARAWLQQKAPDWVLLAELYYSIAPRYGTRPDVALAQACKETGFFRFGGLVKPEQNNFAGLGATGPGKPGASFPDQATGVEAHLQHLYAYAVTENLPTGVKKVDPRFDLVKRGTAPYVEHLGAAENPAGVGWAYPGKDYGHSIVRDYLAPLISMQPQLGQDQELQALKEQLQTLRAENDQLRRQAETAAAEIRQAQAILRQVYGLAKNVLEN